MKLRYSVLALAASLALGLSACGGAASSAASSAAASSSSAASEPASSASSEASAAEAVTLEPLETFSVTAEGSVVDGDYAASIIGGGEVTIAQDGSASKAYNYTLQLYSYDQYDAAAASSLKVGDTIIIHTTNSEAYSEPTSISAASSEAGSAFQAGGDVNDTVSLQEIKIETIESSNGVVTINGGIENGGIYLKDEGDTYRTLGMDDYPGYYPVGESISIDLASDAVLNDSSADYGADAVTTEGDAAVAGVIATDETGFYYNNTTVTVKDGAVTRINRIWVP